MSRICFAAVLAIITASASVRAEGTNPPAALDAPKHPDMRAEALKQFDKDGDGKLNDAERTALMEARKAMGEKMRLAREKEFDKDGDGKLSDTERAAMMEAFKQRHPEGGMRQELIKRFDKDGDGKLNDEERKAMMEEHAKRMKDKDATPAPAPKT